MNKALKHSKIRIGLALGSGGARGCAHIGVLRYLLEKNVPIHCVVGTSIGAIVGAAFAANRLDVLEGLVEKLDWRQVARLFAEVGIPKAGLITGKRIQQLIQDIVQVPHIEDMPILFAAIATDLQLQDQIVLKKGLVGDAIRSSIAIPGIFVPGQWEGHTLIDGAMTNPLPIDVVRSFGVDVVIAVDVNHTPGRGIPSAMRSKHAHEVREPARDVPEILAKMSKHLAPLQEKVSEVYQHWSHREHSHALNIFDVLTRAARITERQLTQNRLTLHPPDILIRPSVSDIETLEFNCAVDAMAAGHAAALACSDDIQRLLS